MKELESIHRALADRSRLRIMNILHQTGELCVCDIEALLGFSQTKVSRHLAYLRGAGLVSVRRKGLWKLYSIPEPLGPMQQEVLTSTLRLLKSDRQAQRDLHRFVNRVQKGCCVTLTTIKSSPLPVACDVN
jgi:ArsR family transcriptional regulator